MMELEALTQSVCEIAKQAGSYIRTERSKFSLESVERKHAHDYVSYVDKGSEQFIVTALRQLLPEAGLLPKRAPAATMVRPATYGWSIRSMVLPTSYISMLLML